MSTSPKATDILQSLEGHALLASKVSFNSEGFYGRTQLLNISIFQILDSDVRIDVRFAQDGFGAG